MSTIAPLVIGRPFATPSKEGEKYHIALSRFRSVDQKQTPQLQGQNTKRT